MLPMVVNFRCYWHHAYHDGTTPGDRSDEFLSIHSMYSMYPKGLQGVNEFTAEAVAVDSNADLRCKEMHDCASLP